MDAFWIPDVMLASLPAELWQVMVFWAAKHPELADAHISRQEAVRFALFWYLCVWNNEKAAVWAFELIKAIIAEKGHFPGLALYHRLTGTDGGDACAYSLIRPEDFEHKLCKPATAAWRTDRERFGSENERNEIGQRWWWNGRKMLPWLQRDYVSRMFPGFSPLTDHEEDLPYDVDHICASIEWGDDWRNVLGRCKDVDAETKKRMRDGRNAIGNGVGNLRLVESSTNKSDQDAPISEKMPLISDHSESGAYGERAITDWAFSPERCALGNEVSRAGKAKDRIWDNSRLAAFQQAVELRAAWLYRRFHDDLGYGEWHSAPPERNAHE